MSLNIKTVSSAQDATDVLKTLQLANREQLHEAILHILTGVAARQLPPQTRLQIAEVIRARGDDVVAGYRTSYNDRPLPLGSEEEQRFIHAMQLFAAFEQLYFEAFQTASSAPANDPVRKEMAGALQRAMACIVGQMIEHYRARQTVGRGLWQRLQRHMQAATREQLENVEIADPLNPSGAATPLATYSRALLLSIAQAGAMAHRSLEATLALTGLFANLVETVMLDNAGPGGAAESVAGVGIQRNGRIRIVAVAGVTHLVNTKKIADALNWCVSRLSSGETPEQIGLATVARADLNALLPRLQRIWCGAGDIRETVREAIQGPSHVAIGFQEIHKLACPTPIIPPRDFDVYKTGKLDEVNVVSGGLPVAEPVPTERWEVLDQSASGMRAKRPQPGARLRRGQILGVDLRHIHQGSGIVLAEVRWLQQFGADDGGGIAAGVKFLSLHAQPALVRTFGVVRERYQDVGPGFVLDDSHEPQLALPTGWFAAGRKLDLWYRDKLTKLELIQRMAYGADYEIVACRAGE